MLCGLVYAVSCYARSYVTAANACLSQVLFQQVPVLAFKFCALSYDLRCDRRSSSGKCVLLSCRDSNEMHGVGETLSPSTT